MSLELWNSFLPFATFLVVAATAIAALVQLRHLRSSNHIAAINELRKTTASPEMQAALYFVETQLDEKLKDPRFRHKLVNAEVRTNEDQELIGKINLVGNFYEGMGVLLKERLVNRRLVLEIWCVVVRDNWEKLAPLTAMYRRNVGTSLWENFEYLAVLSQDWLAANPKGTYPNKLRRIDLMDLWLEADVRYTASSPMTEPTELRSFKTSPPTERSSAATQRGSSDRPAEDGPFAMPGG